MPAVPPYFELSVWKSVERSRAVAKVPRPQQAKTQRGRTLESAADIRAGVARLRVLCPAMRRVHDLVGDPPLRRLDAGFGGLAQVVVGQQLSAASAAAIWGRTRAAVEPFDASTLLATDVAALRAAGLSNGKVQTLRAVAEALSAGALSLDRDALATGHDALQRGRRDADVDLVEALIAIRGVGPWTADVYVMFCLGHADGFAPGDLALQLAAARALGLDARPSARELAEISERWRPWRGVAARLLWAFHVHRDGAAAPDAAQTRRKRR